MDNLTKEIHIEEYVKNIDSDNHFEELFEGDVNIDLKTELNESELILVNKINQNAIFLKEKIGHHIYKDFLTNYLRFKVSYLRQSRKEFVDVNRQERFEQNLGRFNNFANLSKVKE